MKRIVLYIILITIILATVAGFLGWKYIYKSNTGHKEETSFFITHNDDYEAVKSKLASGKIVGEIETFDWVAKKMNLPNHIYSGRYIIKPGLNNKELVELLRSGEQTPVRITFNNIRTKNQLAKRLSEQIEPDSTEIVQLLNNAAYAQKFGFTNETFLCMFLPNTYEVYWNLSAEKLFERMHKEYKRFWTPEKIQKANSIGLTPLDVSILASIVQKETSIIDEYGTIAGVYHNRLKKGMRLQADPTVVYAVGDFSLKRVLHKHLEIDSPYNTYKYGGLPPGPISLPSIQAINSVLNKNSHNYLYFCAKDDFSGKHVFARTLRQHNENARLYRKALNKRKIY